MILDTDIGTDVDDALALALALNSPEIELLAVTTVHFDPLLRACIAAKMLRTWGREAIPVAAGWADRFDGSAANEATINQAAVLSPDDPQPCGDGIQLLIETIKSYPGEVVLVPIGPLSNIATVFAAEPGLTEMVKEIVIMGGTFHTERKVEYNIASDPAAAAYVLDLPVTKTLVPLDVTLRCRYRPQRHAQLQQAGTASTRLMGELIRAWQAARDQIEPILHDPLAVAVTFAPDLVKLEPKRVKVYTIPEDDHPVGECVEIAGEPNASVAVDVDGERFEDLFAQRLIAGP